MKKTNALRILDKKNINYDLIEYNYDPNNLNVSTIAKSCDLDVQIVFKTLVVKGDKTGVITAVIGGDKSLNFKELATKSGNKKIAMLPVNEIQRTTGYIRGGCSPLGMKKTYPVFIDSDATHFDKIYVNAGVRGMLFGISPLELAKITEGTFEAIGTPMEII